MIWDVETLKKKYEWFKEQQKLPQAKRKWNLSDDVMTKKLSWFEEKN